MKILNLLKVRLDLGQLPDRLQEIARLRVDNQDITLKELGELVSGGMVSKSGVNHRLRKIEEIAENLRNGGIGSRESELEGVGVIMAERIVEVKLKSGLQARQAALFVQEANRFTADIFLKKE